MAAVHHLAIEHFGDERCSHHSQYPTNSATAGILPPLQHVFEKAALALLRQMLGNQIRNGQIIKPMCFEVLAQGGKVNMVRTALGGRVGAELAVH